MTISRLEIVLTTYSPVWRELSHVMTHRDLQVMSMTSKSLQRLVFSYLEKMCDIDLKLSMFVPNVEDFWTVLRDTRGVITGGFARAYFIGLFLPRVLNIVLTDAEFDAGVKRAIWEQYFRSFEGANTVSVSTDTSKSSVSPTDAACGSQQWMLMLQKLRIQRNSGTVIHVHILKKPFSYNSFHTVFRMTHLTSVCVVTYNAAHCIFPWQVNELVDRNERENSSEDGFKSTTKWWTIPLRRTVSNTIIHGSSVDDPETTDQ